MTLENTSIFILGNGSSQRNFDFNSIDNYDSMGMNVAFRYWHRINWYPTYYICLDTVMIETQKEEIRKLIIEYNDRIKLFFVRKNLLNFYPYLEELSNVLFLEDYLQTPFFSSLKQHITTGSFAPLFATMLGYRKIQLLGIDLNLVERIPESKSVGGNVLEIMETPKHNPNYFFDDYQQKGEKYNIPNVTPNFHYKSWCAVKIRLDKFDVKVLNCNPNSKLDIFEFKNFLSIGVNSINENNNELRIKNKKKNKSIVFFGINSPIGFSGGRYHAWMMAEAASELGWDVSYITQSKPSFYQDFQDKSLFPNHDNIKIYLCQVTHGNIQLPDIECDILIVIPHNNCHGAFVNNALDFASRSKGKLCLLNFESANWYNLLSPVKRPESNWNGWKELSCNASMILSLADEGNKYAKEFYTQTPSKTIFSYLWPTINTKVADSLPKVIKEKRILIFYRVAYAEHKGGSLIPKLLCDAMQGYTISLILSNGDIDEEVLKDLKNKSSHFNVNLEFLETISEEEKWLQLKKASLIIYPSFFEGFGLPPVEAQYAGTPCIAFYLPVLEEVSGDGIIYVAPGDTVTMRAKITKVLGDNKDYYDLSKSIGTNTGFEVFKERIEKLFFPYFNATKIDNKITFEKEITAPSHEQSIKSIKKNKVNIKNEKITNSTNTLTCISQISESVYSILVTYDGERSSLKAFCEWVCSNKVKTRVTFVTVNQFKNEIEIEALKHKYFKCSIVNIPTSRYSKSYLNMDFDNKIDNLRKLNYQFFDEGIALIPAKSKKFRYIDDSLPLPLKQNYNHFKILHRFSCKKVSAFSSKGIQSISMDYLLDQFIDIHKGKRCFVIGNGPSLKKIDMKLLKNEITFGSNRAYLGFKEWGYNFKYWCVLDAFQCEKYYDEWNKHIPNSTTKIIPFEYLELFNLKNSCPVNFYPTGHPENRNNFINPETSEDEYKKYNNFSNTPSEIFLGHTVTYALIQIASLMGCNPIILVGCDHKYNISETDKKKGLWSEGVESNHFHNSYAKDKEFQLPELEKSEKAFNYADSWSKMNGIEILNATPNTRLNSFKKVDFRNLFEYKKNLNKISKRLPILQIKPSATILICTPNIASPLFTKCINSLKKFTTIRYELIILENGRLGYFSHPEDINRALNISRSEIFFTLDDDVELTEGWAESLIDCRESDVGLIGCVNINAKENARGTTRYVAASFDKEGRVRAHNEKISQPIMSPHASSCCMLINDKTLRFDTTYEKYYQEGDLCMQVWEKEQKVIISPHSIFHYGGGTMEYLGCNRKDIHEISDRDRLRFKKKWIETKKINDIYKKIQPHVAYKLTL